MTAPLNCPTPRRLPDRFLHPKGPAARDRFVELSTPLLFPRIRRRRQRQRGRAAAVADA